MSLKSRVNLERTSSRVHASSVKSILNILKGKLASIIPMLVVFMLSQKRDSSLGVIGIKLRHVKIIDEVDQLVFANGSVSLTSLLFKLLF